MWLRNSRLLPSQPSSHPRAVVAIRVVVGIWLLVAGAILCASDYWWGVLMVVPAALHFYLAYREDHSVRG